MTGAGNHHNDRKRGATDPSSGIGSRYIYLHTHLTVILNFINVHLRYLRFSSRCHRNGRRFDSCIRLI